MELHQSALLKGFGSGELKELFQIVGALAEPRPPGGPLKTPGKTASKATQMFGHGNKAFGGGAGFSTGLLLGLIDIGAAAHKEMVDLLGLEREVVGTAKAQIGDGCPRIRVHTLSKALQGWPIEGFLVGLANEVVGGDHKALTVEGQLKGGAKLGAGVTLALLDGAGIEVIARNQAMVNVTLPSQFLWGLLIEYTQPLKQVAPSLPQGAWGEVIEVRVKAREGEHKQGVELPEIGEAVLLVEVVSPPALF